MRTTKPISTVWFGSEEFLKYKLDDLVKRNVIDFYAFIKHLPEEDQKKEHRHLYVVPSSRIDTQSLTDHLTEFDTTNLKPIIPLPWRSSKFGDWLLYNLHDSVYLASKGQERKYHYDVKEVVTSNDDYFTELRHQIDMSKFKTQDRVKAMLEQGIRFQDIVAMGVIPVQQINQYKVFADMILDSFERNYKPKTNRNGKVAPNDDDDLPF